MPIPLLLVPGLSGPEQILPDTAHIFHIKGFGQDFSTSCVVYMAKLGVWPGRSLDARLSHAYDAFRTYCGSVSKTTGIDGFSKLIFDMASKLVLGIVLYKVQQFVCMLICITLRGIFVRRNLMHAIYAYVYMI